MRLDSTMSRAGRCRILLCAILLPALSVRVEAAGPEDTTKFDCGVNALFLLFQLEGRPVTLDRLEAALPPRHPDGYSMAELAATARTLGLRLEGVQFSEGSKRRNRPAIAFLKDAKGGHFAVLRPVGTTGTMVQVIDPPSPCWIGDYHRVLAGRTWTGRILIPAESWIVRSATPLLVSTAGLLLIALAIWNRLRLMSAGRAPEPRPTDLAPPMPT